MVLYWKSGQLSKCGTTLRSEVRKCFVNEANIRKRPEFETKTLCTARTYSHHLLEVQEQIRRYSRWARIRCCSGSAYYARQERRSAPSYYFQESMGINSDILIKVWDRLGWCAGCIRIHGHGRSAYYAPRERFSAPSHCFWKFYTSTGRTLIVICLR